MPDPVFTFGLVQCIQVQDGFPFWLRLAVFGQRRTAPDAAFVVLVLPEVVVVITDLLHTGDLGVGIQHLQDAGLQLLEALRGGDFRFGPGVLCLHPLQWFFASDFFQPGVLVVSHFRGFLGKGTAGGGKAGGDHDGLAGMYDFGHQLLHNRHDPQS